MTRDKPVGGPSKQGTLDKFAGPGATGPPPPGVALGGMPDSAALMAAITQSRDALDAKIGAVGSDVMLLRQDLRNAVTRLTEAETRLSDVEDTVATLQKRVSSLETTQRGLAARAEDAEGRARRNNIRFVGFPEGCEAGDMEQFIATWVESWMPPNSLSKCFVVERAHRALLQKPPPGARPRPVIARLLNYHDRDVILKQARANEPLLYKDARILIFPDYTKQVQQQRQSFLAAKARLRDLKLQYALLYPARLRVIYRSRTHFFNTPEEVFQWTDETVRLRPHSPPGRDSDSSSSGMARDNSKVKVKRATRSRSRRRSGSGGASARAASASGRDAPTDSLPNKS